MLEVLQIFSEGNFILHGHGYLWKPGLVWLHVASDVIIALSYFSIPLLLIYFLRQRTDIPFQGIFYPFSVFIIVCGTTHLMAVWTLWYPIYWLSSLFKVITAGVSFYAAVKMVRLIPEALAVPNSLTQLEATNQALAQEIQKHRQTETELRESTQRLSLLVKQTPLAVIEWTSNFEVADWNPAAERIFGYSKQEALGGYGVELMVPDTAREQVNQVWGKLLLQQGGTRSTNENFTKEGHKIYCEWYNTPLIDSEGEVIGVASLVQDITERKLAQEALQQANNQLEIQVEARTQELKQALDSLNEVIIQLQSEIEQRQQVEAALREREEQYRSVVDNVKEVIFQTDANGLWTFLNPAWSEILGFAIAQSIGTLFLDYVHPDDRQRNLEQFQSLIERKKEYCRHEVRYLTASGGYRWIEVFAQLTLDADGMINGICGTLYDITEHHLSEAALKASEHRYRAIVEDQTEIICRFLPDGTITFVNEAYCSYFGKSREELIGHQFVPLMPEEDAQKIKRQLTDLSQENPVVTYEYQVVTPQGELRTQQRTNRAIFNEQGNLIEFQAVGRDITEHKQAEVALFKRERYLAALVEVQRRLLAFKGDRQYGLLTLNPYTEILELLGQVSSASRVYVFENHWDATGGLLMSQRAEWSSIAIHKEINNPVLQNLSYDNFFPRWRQLLSQDEIITGVAAEFPESERIVLELHGILSILILPLTVNGKFFGFIGFDNCIEARPWQTSEVDLLRAAAAAVSLWHESFLAHKALRQSEATNRALLDAIPDALLRIRKDGTYLNFVPAKDTPKLISASEFIGKKVSEVLPAEWDLKLSGDVEAALRTGKVQVSEGLFPVNDEQHYYELRTVFYSENEVLTIVRDVTESKRAEVARHKSETRLRKQHIALSELAQCSSIYNGNLSVALQEITRVVTRTLEAERCSVWFYNDDCSLIHCVDLYELTPQRHSAGYQLEAAKYPNYFKALEAARIIAAKDAQIDARTQEFSASYLTPLGITSMLDVPIRLGGITVGVLRTEHTGSKRRWALEEQNFVSTIAYMASLAMEASHRAVTEKALRESEERFRSLVAHIPGVVYRSRYEANWITEFISDAIEGISGYPAADFLHNQVRSIASLIDPQDLARVKQVVLECVAQRQPYVLEYRIVRADGSVRWLYDEGQGVFDADGTLVWLDGVIFDITESKQTQEELRRSEEQFRQLTENLREVFFLSTPDLSQMLYISPAYEEVWGRTRKSLYKRPSSWMASVHPKDHDRIETAIARQLQGEQDFDEEYRIVRPGGSVRWVWVRAFRVLNEAGVVTRLAGIAEDITEHKRAQAEIFNALLQEKELSDLRARFVSITSHEFRTPLTTIMSTTELLEYYEWTKEEELEQLHLIQDAVKHMLQLLEDLLFIGTADAGQLRFNPSPVILNEFCQELVAEIQQGMSLKLTPTPAQQALSFVSPDQTFLAYMDRKLLRQLLSNLLVNAIKYSPSGGTIQFELAGQGDEVIFQIQDQGIGIPKEDLPRLFEFFHRGKNVGVIAGTGLGLAIVKKCVDLHGGRISVDSEVGVGTLFKVTLPLNNFKVAQNQRAGNWVDFPISNP
jgi:PAS domain S-box-containing protein